MHRRLRPASAARPERLVTNGGADSGSPHPEQEALNTMTPWELVVWALAVAVSIMIVGIPLAIIITLVRKR